MTLPSHRLPPARVGRVVAVVVAMALSGPLWAQSLLNLAVSRSPLSLPLYVAEAEGLFEDAGLRVHIADCAGGHRCMRMVLDGSVEVATAGDTPIMFNSFVTPDFVVLGTIASTTNDLKLIVRQDTGISAPRGLPGRKIGVVAETASQYFLDSFLLIHGIEPRLVTAVPMQPEEMLEALQSRRVDGVAVWEPYGYRIAGVLKAGAVQLSNAGVYNGTFNLVAQRKLAGVRDADLSRLLAAVGRAQQFIREQPARAQAILRRRLATDDAFVQWVWPQQVYRLSLDQSLLKTLESEARWAIREGHVGARTTPNFLPFFHRAPLMAVNPSAVGISR